MAEIQEKVEPRGNILKRDKSKREVSMHIPDSPKLRVVVIGGGFGGIRLIKKLARSNNFQIVLLDRNNYHTFQPLLYQVATSGLEPDSIAGPLRKIFSGYRDFYFRMAKVDRVFPDNNCVDTNIGRLKYDYLVIATGSKTNYYGNEELKKSAFPMKQIPQALDLRSKILQNFENALLSNDDAELNSLLDIVIVGGGPTGVELAGAVAELRRHVLPKDIPELDFSKMDIYLVEAGPKLLPGMSDEASRKSKEYLEEFGVQVLLNKMVKNYDGLKVEFADEDTLMTQTMIWAAGVMGSIIPGLQNDSVIKGRYVVDRYNRIKNYDNIFAIGDAAGMYTDETPKGHPMLAQVAIQMGENLANNLNNISRKKELTPFKYKDKGSMATVGRNRAVVDLPRPKVSFGGVLAWFVWMFVHLLFLIGFRNKVVTLIGWVSNYFTYDRATRLIIRPWVREKHKPDE